VKYVQASHIVDGVKKHLIVSLGLHQGPMIQNV